MDFFDTTVLAVLQGVAEFLPISSSGHLVIAQHALDVKGPAMGFDVMLHAGTLLSIAVFYASTLAKRVAARDLAFAAKILVSAVPAVVVYFFFQDEIDALFENAKMVGALLMFTGAVLVGTRYLPRGKRPVSCLRAFLMGCGQALALLPGVSRSGLTLAVARGGRIDAAESAEFSFLMSAPLILGGVFLEVVKSWNGSDTFTAGGFSWPLALYGGAVAAVVGYFSLKILVRTLQGRGFWLFGPYCLAVGLLTLVLV